MTLACILVTHLPMKFEQLRHPALRDRPALVYEQSGTMKTVLDRSEAARDVTIGMPLEDALTRCPYAAIVEADAPAYRELWGRMLDALETRSPVLEDADLGIAYLDLKGLEALYRGNAGVIRAVLGALPAAYRPRVGIAGGKFIAYVAALQAEPGSAYHAPADAAAFLSGLSVLRLPGPWEMRARLWDFGLRTIGSVARIPFDAMQGEFGAEGARLWHLANGQDPEHLLPRSHETRIHVETSFPAPSASLPVIFVALESLLVKVFGGIRGQYARAAVLEGRIAGRPPWVKRCVFKEAVGDANQALPLLRDRLGQLTLPGPLDGLSLTLSDFTGEPGRQESLFLDVRRHADMDEAIRQLRVRMGYSPMYQIREMEPWSRIPERRHALVPYEP